MLRNYISAALGNIGRNGPYAAITILGLAVSFTAAILIGLYVRDEFSFDRFIPGHERVYRMQDDLLLPGQKPRPTPVVQGTAAANMKLDFPEVERAARMANAQSLIKIGDRFISDERFVWVDPDFFKIMPLPVLAGDPVAALASPDGLVLTRQTARKIFGEDKPLGRTVLIDPGLRGRLGLSPGELKAVSGYHPMTVRAVLDDLPSSSHLTATVFAAGRAPFSPLSVEDRHSSVSTQDVVAYVKLKPGVSPTGWDARFKAFAERHYRNPQGQVMNRFWLARLDDLHFTPSDGAADGDRRVDLAIAAVGVLIVAIAAINFVTLVTARATRRAVEVGVRKAAGARRRDLIVQFMGEALIYVVVALLIAVVAAELGLAPFNAFIRRELRFDYLADPAVPGALLGAALMTAALAGIYPALVLSGFRPAAALKGGAGQPTGSAVMRQVLVIVQFAILTGLIVMTATIYRQTQFVLDQALRLNTDQVVRIFAPCGSAFDREARRLAGVKAGACASGNALMQFGTAATGAIMPDRRLRVIYIAQVGPGFFEVHGLQPAAGRFFSRDRGEDMVLDRPNPPVDVQPTIVLNETGARFLGFSKPQAAVGKTIIWERWSPALGLNGTPPDHPSQVIGVVPDFTLGSARTAVRPMMFFVDPNQSTFVLLKLDRQRIPETLEALRQLWRRTGHDRPPSIVFESQSIQALYRDVITQGQALAVCAGIAIVIACLGLFALAAFVTERRTKEIGVRKAMGASSLDVVRLLLWQFTRPVLWANLAAWPAAFFAMDYWLHGFAYRVGQPAWLFLAASLAAGLIAWATVSLQSLRAARAKPATALRYE